MSQQNKYYMKGEREREQEKEKENQPFDIVVDFSADPNLTL